MREDDKEGSPSKAGSPPPRRWPKPQGTPNLMASGFEGQAHIACMSWKLGGHCDNQGPLPPGANLSLPSPAPLPRGSRCQGRALRAPTHSAQLAGAQDRLLTTWPVQSKKLHPR